MQTRQIGVYLYITYGVVIIEIYSCIKGFFAKSCIVFSLILPKHAKTREPEDEHCVSWCTYIYIYVTPYP